LLDHPYGITNGKLHPMWNPKNNSRGVQVIFNFLIFDFIMIQSNFI